MNFEERTQEAILLKERWSLIQSGVDRSDIKFVAHSSTDHAYTFSTLSPALSDSTLTASDSNQPTTTLTNTSVTMPTHYGNSLD